MAWIRKTRDSSGRKMGGTWIGWEFVGSKWMGTGFRFSNSVRSKRGCWLSGLFCWLQPCGFRPADQILCFILCSNIDTECEVGNMQLIALETSRLSKLEAFQILGIAFLQLVSVTGIAGYVSIDLQASHVHSKWHWQMLICIHSLCVVYTISIHPTFETSITSTLSTI